MTATRLEVGWFGAGRWRWVWSALWLAGVSCTDPAPSPPGPVAPPFTMTVTCGTYNAGLTSARTLGVVFDPAPSAPVEVSLGVPEVSGMNLSSTMICPAGKRLCVGDFPEVPAWSAEGGGFAAIWWNTEVGGGKCSSADGALPQPEGHAEVVAGRLEVSWSAVPGAAAYQATFRDLGWEGGASHVSLGRMVTAGLQTFFELPPGGLPPLAVVELEAWATDPEADFTGEALPAGGAHRSMRAIPVIGAPWTLKQPSDFAAGSLKLQVPEGQRLAIVLMNLGGRGDVAGIGARDGAVASVQAVGTGPVAPPRVVRASGRAPVPEVRRNAAAVPAPGRSHLDAGAVYRSFCTFEGHEYETNRSDVLPRTVRRPATLRYETDRVLLYVDVADAAAFTLPELEALAAWWEVLEASALQTTGPLSDVDGNGRFIVLFTGALGSRSRGVGNIWDLDTPPAGLDCLDALQSNAADMIHVQPPRGLTDFAGNPLPSEAAWDVVKGNMAYALQRMADWEVLCGGCTRENDAHPLRMSLAESLAGAGYHAAPIRALDAPWLFGRASPAGGAGGYPSLLMFPYQITPENRAAAGSFIQYLADRLGSGFVTPFMRRATMLRHLETTSGLPLPIAYALWTGALVFSNEPFPHWEGFDYTGADWTPLHQKFQRFEYPPLPPGAPVPVTLRQNGFDVYVTGVAGPGGGTVTVTSAEAVRPYVSAIPFQGEFE